MRETLVAETLEKMAALPFDATSSMHRDFIKGGRTEFTSLTTAVVELGEQLHVPTPEYTTIVYTINSWKAVYSK
jgi:ketopantoate reductase